MPPWGYKAPLDGPATAARLSNVSSQLRQCVGVRVGREIAYTQVRCRYNPDAQPNVQQVVRTFRWDQPEEQRLHDVSQEWFKKRSKRELQQAVVRVGKVQVEVTKLKACRDWQQLCETLALAEQPEPLSKDCVLACAGRLARVVRWVPPASAHEERELLSFLQRFADAVPAALPLMDATETAMLLHNLQRLARPLHLPWLPSVLAHLLPHLPLAPPAATAHTLSAAAAFHHTLTAPQLLLSYQAVTHHLHALPAPACIDTLAALAPYQPPRDLLQSLCRHIFQRLDGLTLPQLSHLAATLLRCHPHPGPAAVDRLAGELALLLSDPRRLAPRARPSLRRGELRARPKTPTENTPHYSLLLASLLASLMQLQYRPQVFWLKIVLTELQRCVGVLAALEEVLGAGRLRPASRVAGAGRGRGGKGRGGRGSSHWAPVRQGAAGVESTAVAVRALPAGAQEAVAAIAQAAVVVLQGLLPPPHVQLLPPLHVQPPAAQQLLTARLPDVQQQHQHQPGALQPAAEPFAVGAGADDVSPVGGEVEAVVRALSGVLPRMSQQQPAGEVQHALAQLVAVLQRCG